MAATMKAKISKQKLDKLDIIQICEEILNPAVPMALRLSGILMGGVVIVYERKVNLLYEDVNRVLVEINIAWKAKAKPKVDRTVLSKSKSQAKFEAVTLPQAIDMEIEQSRNFSDAANKFKKMRLDDMLEELDINADGQFEQHHQADAANITLFDDFSCLGENYFNNQFERFDIDGDEEMPVNFTPQDNQILTSSPPKQDAAQNMPPFSVVSSPHTNQQEAQNYETKGPIGEDREDLQQPIEQNNEPQKAERANSNQKPRSSRRGRKNHSQVIIDEQIMISGHTYQEWLQDASTLLRKRARKIKHKHPILTTKIDILMEIPPVALLTGFENFPNQLHYPARLLELWRKCTANDLPTAAQQNTTSHSPPEVLSHRKNDAPEFAKGEQSSGNSSQLDASSAENLRVDFSTPISPGRHSSGSFQQEILSSSAKGKKRQLSSARSDLGNLDPVEEELPLVQGVRGLKIQSSAEDNPAQYSDLLEETGPTQTPHLTLSEPTVDKITQSVRTQFKMNFETPGHPQVESINDLASGMNRKLAASLFYQTCVLATMNCVKVDQAVPYGDILIFKGPKL